MLDPATVQQGCRSIVSWPGHVSRQGKCFRRGIRRARQLRWPAGRGSGTPAMRNPATLEQRGGVVGARATGVWTLKSRTKTIQSPDGITPQWHCRRRQLKHFHRLKKCCCMPNTSLRHRTGCEKLVSRGIKNLSAGIHLRSRVFPAGQKRDGRRQAASRHAPVRGTVMKTL